PIGKLNSPTFVIHTLRDTGWQGELWMDSWCIAVVRGPWSRAEGCPFGLETGSRTPDRSMPGWPGRPGRERSSGDGGCRRGRTSASGGRGPAGRRWSPAIPLRCRVGPASDPGAITASAAGPALLGEVGLVPLDQGPDVRPGQVELPSDGLALARGQA